MFEAVKLVNFPNDTNWKYLMQKECCDYFFFYLYLWSYAVIFAETLDILFGALEVLIEQSEPLGLWVSWVKTKIQTFNDILDASILSVPVCGKDIEVM